jgi:hypothetical protein
MKSFSGRYSTESTRIFDLTDDEEKPSLAVDKRKTNLDEHVKVIDRSEFDMSLKK